jgi:hypothetical protein
MNTKVICGYALAFNLAGLTAIGVYDFKVNEYDLGEPHRVKKINSDHSMITTDSNDWPSQFKVPEKLKDKFQEESCYNLTVRGLVVGAFFRPDRLPLAKAEPAPGCE